MLDHLIGETLSLYIDRRLPVDQIESAKKHLQNCSTCTQEVEDLENLKVRLSSLPKHYAPPQLVAGLRRRHLGTTPSLLGWLRHRWKPLGALAGLALVGSVWFGLSRPSEDYVDMDALLAAHSKYQAEGLVPQGDFAQADYSARLASFYRDEE